MSIDWKMMDRVADAMEAHFRANARRVPSEGAAESAADLRRVVLRLERLLPLALATFKTPVDEDRLLLIAELVIGLVAAAGIPHRDLLEAVRVQMQAAAPTQGAG